MSKVRYPELLDITLNVLIRADHGEKITPELVDRALSATSRFAPGPESFEIVRANLDRVHFIDDHGELTPVADRYADMWRRHLAKQAKGDA
jgi:hypothetical protein